MAPFWWIYPNISGMIHMIYETYPEGHVYINIGQIHLMGKLTISMAMFNSYVSHYQTVEQI